MKLKLALLLFGSLISYCLLELFSWAILLPRYYALPLVKYRTEKKNVELWTYDKHFNGRADFNLLHDHPYKKLEYCCNEDFDISLTNLDPKKVPHAIEVKFGPLATRDDNFYELPPESEKNIIFGDSFCFGQGVRKEDRFTDLIEAELNKQRSQRGQEAIHVMSSCYCGLDIDGAKRVFDNHKHLSGLKRIIYAYVLNDPVSQSDAILHPLNDLMHLRKRGSKGALFSPPKGVTPFLSWVNAYGYSKELTHDTEEWYRALHQGESWERTRKTILAMAHEAHSLGKEFYLVIFPLFYKLKAYPFKEIHQNLRGLGTDSPLKVIDLLEIFEGETESTYWVHPKDFHPNYLAHQRVAEFLLEKIPWETTTQTAFENLS